MYKVSLNKINYDNTCMQLTLREKRILLGQWCNCYYSIRKGAWNTLTHTFCTRGCSYTFSDGVITITSLSDEYSFFSLAMQLQKLCHFNFSWTYLVSVTTLALFLKCVTIFHLVLKLFISLSVLIQHQFY